MTFADGTFYEGKFKNGYKNGEGVIKLENSRLRKGVWELGLLK